MEENELPEEETVTLEKPEQEESSETPEVIETSEEEITEKELEKKKSKAQTRINELTRRRREAEERENSALEYAEAMKRKAEALESKLHQTDAGYGAEFEARVKSQSDQAEAALQEALDSGDSKRIAAASRAISQVEIEKERARLYKNRLEQRRKTQQTLAEIPREAPQSQPVTQPDPDPKAVKWSDKNEWFGEDKKLTSVAIGIHSDLINEGFDGSSDEYYTELDNRLVPWLGAGGVGNGKVEETETVSTTPKSPVASVTSGRSVAKKPKSVKLTRSELEIANKLGVPKEEYAKELVKLQRNRS